MGLEHGADHVEGSQLRVMDMIWNGGTPTGCIYQRPFVLHPIDLDKNVRNKWIRPHGREIHAIRRVLLVLRTGAKHGGGRRSGRPVVTDSGIPI